jgi:hypothetical protein
VWINKRNWVDRRLGAGSTVGSEVQLVRLDQVLGLSSGAVNLFVERLGQAGEIGDDKTAVGTPGVPPRRGRRCDARPSIFGLAGNAVLLRLVGDLAEDAAMGRIFGVGAAVVMVMSASTGAKADFRSGNELYTECAAAGESQGFCGGYIAAIADVGSKVPVADVMICPSAKVTVGQVVDIVKQYLAVHPERRRFSASSLVANALADEFPCRR